ncbi:hypothetical protein K435DRAFT_808104 [Dendrothele bispora CBS 962.96]|uniref:Uncharacterized protein n=1 Tax=Dendrothele bispora (strain CBS 962.96) TaxID=1314807 RepID=A0A4S8L304_DENBC|nr:hypothetical protein K435DRAFT_808104 [Dendrothele bispora CBS 962.96]
MKYRNMKLYLENKGSWTRSKIYLHDGLLVCAADDVAVGNKRRVLDPSRLRQLSLVDRTTTDTSPSQLSTSTRDIDPTIFKTSKEQEALLLGALMILLLSGIRPKELEQFGVGLSFNSSRVVQHLIDHSLALNNVNSINTKLSDIIHQYHLFGTTLKLRNDEFKGLQLFDQDD